MAGVIKNARNGIFIIVAFLGVWFLARSTIFKIGSQTRDTGNQQDKTHRKSGIVPEVVTLNKWNFKSKSKLVKKVLLFAYMRGGSTFAGEIFHKNPEATYWYEAGGPIYTDIYGMRANALAFFLTLINGTQRHYEKWEKKIISEYTNSLLSCEMEKLPAAFYTSPLLMGSRSTVGFVRCHKSNGNQCNELTRNICGDSVEQSISMSCPEKISLANNCIGRKSILNETQCDQYIMKNCNSSDCMDMFLRRAQCYKEMWKKIDKCSPPLHRKCKSSQIVATKVIRFVMETLDTLLEEHPEVHIVYLIRDPRGIVSSRSNNRDWSDYRMVEHGKLLCSRMLSDLHAAQDLKRRFPGSIYLFRYEDYAAQPIEYAEKVYDFLGQPLPEAVKLFMIKSTNAKKDNGKQGTMRKDSKATSVAWRRKLSPHIITNLTDMCSSFLNEAGYIP